MIAALTPLVIVTVTRISEAQVVALPEPPPLFTATPGDRQVELKWEASAGATGYNVQSGARLVAENIQTTSFTDTELNNDRLVTYTVSALNSSEESSASQKLQVRPSAAILDWLPAGASVERLASRMQFIEGPVWNPADGGFLIFSDVNGNRLHRWDFENGLSVFRQPSNNANGNTLDLEGRLITCEHRTRRVSITQQDGTIETLVDTFEGKRLNSPNDVVVKRDGTVWFTDPTWGLSGQQEQAGRYVFRFDPISKTTTLVADGFSQPNGLCFSPDESILYVAESAGNIRAFDVEPDGTLTGDRVFTNRNSGTDGMRTDASGRLFACGGGRVSIYDTSGDLLGQIRLNELPANIAFGGPDQSMMFITARTSLYGITRTPDLAMTSFTISPEALAYGDRAVFSVLVANEGTGPTPVGTTIRVKFEVDGGSEVFFSETLADPLLPGASLAITRHLESESGTWLAAAGEHTFEAIIEPSEEIHESDKSNNSRSMTRTVSPPNILLSSPNGLTDQGFSLQLEGPPGQSFLIESSTNLVEWEVWRSIDIEVEPVQLLDPSPLPKAAKFYRASQL